ncbi:MAG: SRPBCC domain-containing protein [Phycisphaerales bacterium]|nr:SRPBCC domain-containing protein [Phycisphaerales bacterium]
MVNANSAADGQIHIIREFNAPRSLVFRAWTEAEHLLQWFAPRGCSVTFRSIDARAGGGFLFCIGSPEGRKCWCKGQYREVREPERLVFTMEVSDAEGRSVDPAHAGMDPDWPKVTTVTVTLETSGSGTRLTLHQTVDEALARKTGAYPGWIDMLDRLAERLGHASAQARPGA